MADGVCLLALYRRCVWDMYSCSDIGLGVVYIHSDDGLEDREKVW